MGGERREASLNVVVPLGWGSREKGKVPSLSLYGNTKSNAKRNALFAKEAIKMSSRGESDRSS